MSTVRLNGFLQRIIDWYPIYNAQTLIDMVELPSRALVLQRAIISIPSLPSVRITSEICLLTATLVDKDNPSPDALLSDNSSKLPRNFC